MAEERVIKIGMLGLGTVGTGVYKVLKSQQEEMLPKLGARVELKKILVRNVEKAAAKVDDPSIITTSFEEIANDPEMESIIGALLTGVFAVKEIGAVEGSVLTQLIGVLATVAYSLVMTFVILKVIDLVIGLRVTEEEEREGLDTVSHGESAYHY